MSNDIKINNHHISKMQEINEAKKRGIELRINGVVYDSYEPKEVALLLEEATYMKDYIGDEKGKIIQISYDKIDEKMD